MTHVTLEALKADLRKLESRMRNCALDRNAGYMEVRGWADELDAYCLGIGEYCRQQIAHPPAPSQPAQPDELNAKIEGQLDLLAESIAALGSTTFDTSIDVEKKEHPAALEAFEAHFSSGGYQYGLLERSDAEHWFCSGFNAATSRFA